MLGQKNYGDAEPLLVQGYRELDERAHAIPAGSRDCLKETVRGLVQLYEASGKPKEAARWKGELEATQRPAVQSGSAAAPANPRDPRLNDPHLDRGFLAARPVHDMKAC